MWTVKYIRKIVCLSIAANYSGREISEVGYSWPENLQKISKSQKITKCGVMRDLSGLTSHPFLVPYRSQRNLDDRLAGIPWLHLFEYCWVIQDADIQTNHKHCVRLDQTRSHLFSSVACFREHRTTPDEPDNRLKTISEKICRQLVFYWILLLLPLSSTLAQWRWLHY